MSEGSRPLHLLLLPAVAWPAAASDTLKAAYNTPITATLKQLALERRSEATGSILEIALPVPVPGHNDAQGPRASSYSKVQSLVAGVYRLICIIAANEKINVEDRTGIDVRILLVASDSIESSNVPEDSSETKSSLVTPVIDLPSLARSQRPWTHVYTIDNDKGKDLLKVFLVSQDSHVSMKLVPGGEISSAEDTSKTSDELSEQPLSKSSTETTQEHTSIAVGGTFDHIHIGHKLLLTMFALLLPASSPADQPPRSLTVGITGDALLTKKKYAEYLESWDERHASALSFLLSILDFRPAADAQTSTTTRADPGPNGHAITTSLGGDLLIDCVELSDPFGPTITDEGISALAISAETRSGGEAVNEKRREKGWRELEVFEVDVVDPSEDGKSVEEAIASKLSSTEIRRGLMERREG